MHDVGEFRSINAIFIDIDGLRKQQLGCMKATTVNVHMNF